MSTFSLCIPFDIVTHRFSDWIIVALLVASLSLVLHCGKKSFARISKGRAKVAVFQIVVYAITAVAFYVLLVSDSFQFMWPNLSRNPEIKEPVPHSLFKFVAHAFLAPLSIVFLSLICIPRVARNNVISPQRQVAGHWEADDPSQGQGQSPGELQELDDEGKRKTREFLGRVIDSYLRALEPVLKAYRNRNEEEEGGGGGEEVAPEPNLEAYRDGNEKLETLQRVANALLVAENGEERRPPGSSIEEDSFQEVYSSAVKLRRSLHLEHRRKKDAFKEKTKKLERVALQFKREDDHEDPEDFFGRKMEFLVQVQSALQPPSVWHPV